MARKTPTPPPPRRTVQAPKVRTGKQQPGGFDPGSRTALYALAASGLVALAAVLGFLFLAGGDDGGNEQALASKLRAAGCNLRTVPGQNARPDHSTVPTLTTKVKWNSSPPANGPHYQETAVWGFYDDAVNPRQVVHNLEHGGVAIWWGPQVPDATVEQLRDFYNESPDGMIGTPYPALGDQIALTAWTADPERYLQNGYFGQRHIAKCDRFDEEAFAAFRDTFRGKGPERIPVSISRPGT